ncbi:MAG: methyltransferase domain-containing protein [Dehalococcoidia bacterium]|nr:methyltransferase domain-containing protein [Dehalococcoidia bacterium]
MKSTTEKRYRGWEYATRGDYHRNLDPNWSYTPTYLRKMAFVRRQIRALGARMRILDAGCGEGVLLEEFKAQGFKIEGLDLNYESEYVRLGSILDMPYEDGTFDAVLLLDVFEHIGYADQPVALAEIHRVLRKGGKLITSIPNLAHWNSRFSMAFFGRLDRTDIETNHVGERPFAENRRLIQQTGFQIEQVKGVTLTVPVIYRRVICRRPAWFRWLHDLLEPLAVPSLAMLDIFVCRKS